MADEKKALPTPLVSLAKLDKITKNGYPRFNTPKDSVGKTIFGNGYGTKDWVSVKKVRITMEALE